MTAGELRKKLERVPDDTHVVIDGRDHRYYSAEGVHLIDAEEHNKKFFEYFSDEEMTTGSKKVRVVLVGP